FSSALHAADLDDAAAVGRKAGERAVKRLNPRKVETRKLPVVFDPRVAGGLIGHLASAINGSAVARKTSFLNDRLGQPLFRPRLPPLRAAVVGRGRTPHRARGAPRASGPRPGGVEQPCLPSWLPPRSPARALRPPPPRAPQRCSSPAPSHSESPLYPPRPIS